MPNSWMRMIGAGALLALAAAGADAMTPEKDVVRRGAAVGSAAPFAAINPAQFVRVVDVTAESGRRVTGELTSWTTPDGPFKVEHLAGRDANNDLIVYWWSPRNGRWRSVNASAEAGRKLNSSVTSWQTRLDGVLVEHLAGHERGEVLVFWWSPRSGGWKVVDVTAKTGHRVTGPLTSWTTFSGSTPVHHLAGRTSRGDLIVFWWSPQRDWQAVNVTAKTGRKVRSSIASWQVRKDGVNTEYLVASDDEGRLIEFSWKPGQDWRAVDVTSHTGVRLRQGIATWQTAGVEHLAGTDQNGELRVLWRNGGTFWRTVNVTQLTGETISGRPTTYQFRDGGENVEFLAGRRADGDLMLFWWKPSRDWQALNLSAISGQRIAAAPQGWLATSGSRTVEHLAAVGADGRLRVFWGYEQPRQLTDALSQPGFGVKRMREVRRKVVVILWDPHFPDRPKPSVTAVRNRVFGGSDSVRGFFFENSMRQFTIDNAGVLGWYDADMPLEFYNGNGSRDKAVAAIRAADPDFDFARFDANRNGVLEPHELTIVFAHPGSGGLVRNPGRPMLDDDGNVLEVDGVQIREAVELGIENPPHLGIVAHELSHILFGTADMYFTFFTPSAAGKFSLMDNHRPGGHLDPVHKLKAGWLRPRLVLRSGTYALPAIAGSNQAFVLMDPSRSTKEYFLIENRWPDAGNYDRELPDRGLAVWHVMEEAATFDAADPPPNVDPEQWQSLGGFFRRGVRMVRPDVTRPFQDGKTAYDGSEPGRDHDLVSDDPDPEHGELRWGDGTPSGFAIRDISAAGPTMTFRIEVPGSPRLLREVRASATTR